MFRISYISFFLYTYLQEMPYDKFMLQIMNLTAPAILRKLRIQKLS